MAESKEHGELNQGLEELLQTQAKMEQSAFDAINEHDRYLNMLHTAMEHIQEMLGGLEMLNMEMSAALEGIQDTEQKDAREQLAYLNEQNSQTAGELARVLECLLQEAETGSEVIHRMEEDIALAQDALKAVCDLVSEEE